MEGLLAASAAVAIALLMFGLVVAYVVARPDLAFALVPGFYGQSFPLEHQLAWAVVVAVTVPVAAWLARRGEPDLATVSGHLSPRAQRARRDAIRALALSGGWIAGEPPHTNSRTDPDSPGAVNVFQRAQRFRPRRRPPSPSPGAQRSEVPR